VTELVDRGTLTQLVIYFSGHGVCVGYNEFWLLSGAPVHGNEAVSLVECWELAHRCGVANVAFISDACRSIPTYDLNWIKGGVIFPNRDTGAGKVDRFLATAPGQSSIEAQVAADTYASIYTATFLDAFQHPQDGMVKQIDRDDVIPNYLLEDFLRKQVPLRLGKIDLQHKQVPDTRIESRDNVYIGRALRSAAPRTSDILPKESVTIFDVANHEFKSSPIGSLGTLRNFDVTALREVAQDSGFLSAQATIAGASKPPQILGIETGFVVDGASVRSALAAGEARAEIVPAQMSDIQTRPPSIVRVTLAHDRRPVTVGLTFSDGTGTVIAALPGFIGTLVVQDGKVTSVAYKPAGSDGNAENLNRLHGLVGAAAKYGVFRFEGSEAERAQAAGRLADQIRVLKGVDPTLGIYAAYAYADANLVDQVQSVRGIMRESLGADLFDVALLANALKDKRVDGPSDAVPLCPMLAQGWQLLRVKNVTLAPLVERARADMRDALWTTFGPQGMDAMFGAIKQFG
jgi:hypothetical protein